MVHFKWDNFEEKLANIGKYRKNKKVQEIIEEKELKKVQEVIAEERAIEQKETLEEKELILEEAQEIQEVQEEREIPEVIETREFLESPEEEEVEISNFNIIVEKDGNKISMKCKKGCAWKDLEFSLKENQSQQVDKYGVTSSGKKSNSDFAFLITNKNEKLALRSTKGTAWKGLEFSIDKDEKRQINQFGVQRF